MVTSSSPKPQPVVACPIVLQVEPLVPSLVASCTPSLPGLGCNRERCEVRHRKHTGVCSCMNQGTYMLPGSMIFRAAAGHLRQGSAAGLRACLDSGIC